ncbi:MAG: Npt1/Npt2 family nucleotide transporter [Proteobacteria bacterium]|nr:Npt1/Npt2 family nucleotide transporter [Pseudomonadota bacterium]
MHFNREYQIAAMMASAAMFTLAGYEFIRSSSTVLFKAAYGADNLPLVMAAMPVVVFLGVALYGWILSRLGPRRTLLVTSLGSGFFILACYLALQTGSKLVTPVLFLFKEFYIVLLIEQYWSYINSSVKPETSKRINGPITGIAGIGAAIGGTLVGFSAESFGTETMVLFAAVALLPAALVSNITYVRYGEPEQPPPSERHGTLGLSLFRENPTLASLLAIVLASQVVAAVLDFKFQSLLSVEFAGNTDEETAFQGRFWGTLNTSVLVLQFLVAPLLLSFVGLRLVHLMMPLIHLSAITWALLDPSVLSVGLAFFLFKAFDYSIFRAAKEVLYVPLGFDERYRVKEVIDVFGYRTGKGGSSVLIVLLQRAGVAMNNYYLAVAFAMVLVWLALVFPLTANRTSRSGEQS